MLLVMFFRGILVAFTLGEIVFTEFKLLHLLASIVSGFFGRKIGVTSLFIDTCIRLIIASIIKHAVIISYALFYLYKMYFIVYFYTKANKYNLSLYLYIFSLVVVLLKDYYTTLFVLATIPIVFLTFVNLKNIFPCFNHNHPILYNIIRLLIIIFMAVCMLYLVYLYTDFFFYNC